MHTHSPQRGFTLLEIMIAVAVVAILAAIALPSYNNYSVRSKVNECVSLATTAKLAVNNRVVRSGQAPSSSDEAGFSFSQTEYCDDIRVADGGTIVVETQNTGAFEDPVVQFRLDLNTAIASVSWDCEYVSGDPAHVPSSCRVLGVAATGGGSDDGGSSGGPPSGGPPSGGPPSGGPPGGGPPGGGPPSGGPPGGGPPGGGPPSGGPPGGGPPGGGPPSGGPPSGGPPSGGPPGGGPPGGGPPSGGPPSGGPPGGGPPSGGPPSGGPPSGGPPGGGSGGGPGSPACSNPNPPRFCR